MKKIKLSALFPLLALTGCGMGVKHAGIPDLTGNWQIQSGASAPSPGIILVGALQSQGSQVSGNLRFASLSPSSACGTPLQTLHFSGGVDEAYTLVLTSQTFSGSYVQVNLGIGPASYGLDSGTLQVNGANCTYPHADAVGARIASVTGTFVGDVALPSTLQGSSTGTAKAQLTLSQATTPNADGQFGLTGTLDFSTGTCTDTETLTGLISGASATLASANVRGVQNVQITTGVSPDGSHLPSMSILLAGGPCAAAVPIYSTYAGSLSRK